MRSKMGQGYIFPRLPALQTRPALCAISSNNHTKLEYVHEHLCKPILFRSAELNNPFSDSPILLCLFLAGAGGEGRGEQRLLEATSLPPLSLFGATWYSLSCSWEKWAQKPQTIFCWLAQEEDVARLIHAGDQPRKLESPQLKKCHEAEGPRAKPEVKQPWGGGMAGMESSRQPAQEEICTLLLLWNHPNTYLWFNKKCRVLAGD